MMMCVPPKKKCLQPDLQTLNQASQTQPHLALHYLLHCHSEEKGTIVYPVPQSSVVLHVPLLLSSYISKTLGKSYF